MVVFICFIKGVLVICTSRFISTCPKAKILQLRLFSGLTAKGFEVVGRSYVVSVLNSVSGITNISS